MVWQEGPRAGETGHPKSPTEVWEWPEKSAESVCVTGRGRKWQGCDTAHTCQQEAEPGAVAVLAISGTQIKSKSKDL